MHSETPIIKSLDLSEVLPELLPGIKRVMSAAYHGSHMFEDFLADIESHPPIFRLFLAYLADELVGTVVIEHKSHERIEYHGNQPVHLKRFSVLPSRRGTGIGKQLLDAAKLYAFKEMRLAVLFGESNEAGALSFYGREGALYGTDSIGLYSKRNTPEENLRFFAEFISNSVFKPYRYPEGKGIAFVFPASFDEAMAFESRGYISKSRLLNQY